MSEFQEAVNQYSNFITPPDFVEDEKHTVVLIDVDKQDIQNIAEWAQTAEQAYNIYIFDHSMDNADWLLQTLDRAQACIVNTVPTVLSPGKDKLAEQGKAYYYGPKNFLASKARIESPLEYFVNYDKSIK